LIPARRRRPAPPTSSWDTAVSICSMRRSGLLTLATTVTP
jgi:hypothetical protein